MRFNPKFLPAVPVVLLLVASFSYAAFNVTPTAIRTTAGPSSAGNGWAAEGCPVLGNGSPTCPSATTTVPTVTVTPTTVLAPVADPAVVTATEAVVVESLALAVSDSTNSPNAATLSQQLATATPTIVAPTINSYGAITGPAVAGSSVSAWWTASTNQLPSAGNGVVVAAMIGPSGPCLLAATNTAPVPVDAGSFSEYGATGTGVAAGYVPPAVGNFFASISTGELAAGNGVCDASASQPLNWTASPTTGWSTP